MGLRAGFTLQMPRSAIFLAYKRVSYAPPRDIAAPVVAHSWRGVSKSVDERLYFDGPGNGAWPMKGADLWR